MTRLLFTVFALALISGCAQVPVTDFKWGDVSYHNEGNQDIRKMTVTKGADGSVTWYLEKAANTETQAVLDSISVVKDALKLIPQK